MKVELETLSEEGLERRDYRNFLSISIDGKSVFRVIDGEPEDANLDRDFNDCWKITDLMEASFLAGQRGETFELEIVEVDEP